MQFISQIAGNSNNNLVDLEGIITQTQRCTIRQMDICKLELKLNDELFLLYAVIQPQLLCLETRKFIITNIQLGVMDSKICGMLTSKSQVIIPTTLIIELPLPIINTQVKVQNISQNNPFIIDLRQYFTQDELSKSGIVLSVLNQRLQSIYIPAFIGYILQTRWCNEQKNLVIKVIDINMESYILIDVQCSDDGAVDKYKVGSQIKLKQLQKQSRVLLNYYKTYDNHSVSITDQVIPLKLQNIVSIIDMYKMLTPVTKLMPFSNLNEIQTHTIDRQVRKYKVDLYKTNFVGCQYICLKCSHGPIQFILELYYCSNCQAYMTIDNIKGELLAIVIVKNHQQFAQLKLKDELVLKFFDIPSLYGDYLMKQSLLNGSHIVIREESMKTSPEMHYLHERCYRNIMSQIVVAMPYCDFIKTAKIKEKWKTINKLKLHHLMYEDTHIDYYEWFKPSDHEQLVINPNGSYEIEWDNLAGVSNWYHNKRLVPITCLECYAVWSVDKSYCNYLMTQLK